MDILASSIHALAAVLWVGGIFLVYKVFRPTVMEVDPPVRLKLFLGVFKRFFPWVWLFIIVLVVTGYIDWFVRFGGFDYSPLYMKLMHLIGWVMIILFAVLYFLMYKKFKVLVETEQYPEAGALLNSKMRPIIIINLILGSLEAVIGASGTMW